MQQMNVSDLRTFLPFYTTCIASIDTQWEDVSPFLSQKCFTSLTGNKSHPSQSGLFVASHRKPKQN